MSGPETVVLYASGTLFLIATSARFLMKEAIALVLLYKELRDAVRSDYTPRADRETRQLERIRSRPELMVRTLNRRQKTDKASDAQLPLNLS